MMPDVYKYKIYKLPINIPTHGSRYIMEPAAISKVKCHSKSTLVGCIKDYKDEKAKASGIKSLLCGKLLLIFCGTGYFDPVV